MFRLIALGAIAFCLLVINSKRVSNLHNQQRAILLIMNIKLIKLKAGCQQFGQCFASNLICICCTNNVFNPEISFSCVFSVCTIAAITFSLGLLIVI